MLNQFENLYPKIEAEPEALSVSFEYYRQNLKLNLQEACKKLLDEFPQVNSQVESFSLRKDPEELQKLCDILFQIFPIETEGIFHPLMPAQFQLESYISGKLDSIGDCKLLSIICAYLCNIISSVKVLISVREYNGHPILYLDLPSGVHKVSFRHSGPRVKKYSGESPFTLTARDEYDSEFMDKDFKAGEEQSILYWDILNAVFVLDIITVLRRCLVNYSLNPAFYTETFKKSVVALSLSKVFSDPVIEYWQAEFSRITDWWGHSRSRLNAESFRQRVIDSLRFTE